MNKARLENVDILKVLQMVVDNNAFTYSTDFEYDKTAILSSNSKNNKFFWLCRNSGTWLYTEDEVYLSHTSAHNTWTAYSEKKDSVKALYIEVIRVSEGKAFGNIIELDYEKHLDYVIKNSVKPKEVLATFKDSVRLFSLAEYESNYQSIKSKFGTILSREYLPEDSYKFDLTKSEARFLAKSNTELISDEVFEAKFKDELFANFNYFDNDKEFLNYTEITGFLERGFRFTAITRQGEEIDIQDEDEYKKVSSDDVLFCAEREHKNFLQHLESDSPPLFSQDELNLIWESALYAESENRIKDYVSFNSLMDKLGVLITEYTVDKEVEQNLEHKDIER